MLPAVTQSLCPSPTLSQPISVYQKALEYALNPVAILDKEFNYLFVNQLYAQAAHKNTMDFPGRNHFEIYPNAENQAIFERVVRTKQPYFEKATPFRYAYNTQKRVTYWDWSLAPVLDSQNEIDFLVLASTDVTEHVLEKIKLEELAGRLKEEIEERKKLAAIVESSYDPIIVINRAGEIISWNSAAEKLYGYKAEEILGTHFSVLMPDGHYHHEMANKITSCEKGRILNTIRKTKDGRLVNVAVTYSPIRNESGQVSAISAIVRDTTLQNKMLEKLRREIRQRKQSEAYLKAIFDNSKLGIVISDLNGKVLNCNSALENMLGFNHRELLRMSLAELIHPEDLAGSQALDAEIFEGIRPYYEAEKRMLKNDGSFLWVNHTTVLAHSTGKSIIISFFQDITEKLHFQEQMLRLDRLHLVGEMAAGITHEVRNPMTTVRGFAQLLRDKKEFAAYRDYFELMIEELDRANTIITDFLSIGHNARFRLEKENLSRIVASMKPLIEASAFEQDKFLELELAETPDLMLNQKEIRQVILNLCKNGLEAMAPGKTLTIKTFCQEGQVVLAVCDQGEGIKPELIKKLGTPFLTTKEKGTGLGLGVCYGIAARHNAEISFDTGPAGTTFFVKFKL